MFQYPGIHISHAVDEGLELAVHLWFFGHALQDEKFAAPLVVVVVFVNIGLGDREGDGLHLGCMEMGHG